MFRQDFMSRRSVQDAGGVIVGCTIGNGGVSATATSSRITYTGTEALLGGAAQMTLALRFRTAAADNAGVNVLLAKSPSALNANQFHVHLESVRLPRLYVASSTSDVSNYVTANAALAASTEYLVHLVYNGSLAAGSRGAVYSQGSVVASTITGTLPVVMIASAAQLAVLNRSGGSTLAPATDFVLRSVRIYNTAWSAEECLDDFQQDAYSEVWS